MCRQTGAIGRIPGVSGYRRGPDFACMAILSDRAGIDPAQIAQIGRERAETGRAGFGRGEGLKSPPSRARHREGGDSGA